MKRNLMVDIVNLMKGMRYKMQINLIEKNAVFLFDEEGVIVVTDIEKDKEVVKGELIYDGNNIAILNRNNEEFYSLKGIAPLIREKIKKSKLVTIIEKDKDSIYSYQLEVHLKEDFGFEDSFQKDAGEILSKLKEKMTPQEFEDFLRESEKLIKEMK